MISYFPSLLERPKWHHARRNLSVGDVVVIYDKNLRRGHWKLGLVTDATLGVVRRVKVMMSIILNRITSWYNSQLLDQQQGFRQGRGTTDGIYIIKRIQHLYYLLT